MILQEIKNIKETQGDLKKFGITIGSVLLIISAILFWNEKQTGIWFIVGGILLILTGIIYARILKPINKIWMALAVILGFIMTRVILLIVYFLVLTPIALIARLSGKRFLDLKMSKSSSSYWIKRTNINSNRVKYEKQF